MQDMVEKSTTKGFTVSGYLNETDVDSNFFRRTSLQAALKNWMSSEKDFFESKSIWEVFMHSTQPGNTAQEVKLRRSLKNHLRNSKNEYFDQMRKWRKRASPPIPSAPPRPLASSIPQPKVPLPDRDDCSEAGAAPTSAGVVTTTKTATGAFMQDMVETSTAKDFNVAGCLDKTEADNNFFRRITLQDSSLKRKNSARANPGSMHAQQYAGKPQIYESKAFLWTFEGALGEMLGSNCVRTRECVQSCSDHIRQHIAVDQNDYTMIVAAVLRAFGAQTRYPKAPRQIPAFKPSQNTLVQSAKAGVMGLLGLAEYAKRTEPRCDYVPLQAQGHSDRTVHAIAIVYQIINRFKRHTVLKPTSSRRGKRSDPDNTDDTDNTVGGGRWEVHSTASKRTRRHGDKSALKAPPTQKRKVDAPKQNETMEDCAYSNSNGSVSFIETEPTLSKYSDIHML